jgi:O-methyltransferase domain/Dimerisation domain
VPDPQSPQAQLVEMAMAHSVSRLLYVAAELNLADHLDRGLKTAAELAEPTRTDARSLYRLMRTLSSLGLFTEDPTHRFSLTSMGKALKTGTADSVRTSVLTLAGDTFTRAHEQLLHSVRTGKSGFEKVFGAPLFEWLAKHPIEAAMFNETMVGIHGAEPAAVAAAYDFSDFNTITDVGGSTGNMLTTILRRYPKPRGTLFDLPHVVRDAPAMIEARGLTNRVSVEAGSFFERIPAGSDVYLLSHIIHDWSEEECLTILLNCRQAMKPEARLLIIEMVLPAGDAPHPGKLLDMIMLTIPGGQERTEQEYGELLEKAGLRLARVVPTQSAVGVVEAFTA